jgi:hypothetical protein
MQARTQALPGYYTWDVPGKPVVVHFKLDLVDRILAETIRGAGIELTRPAEVGGILIGTVEQSDPAVVRVEDFETVDCGHKQGPAYVFGDDWTKFEDACRRWHRDGSPALYAVGYFRSSHTSEALSLVPDDIQLLDRHFHEPWHIALLVKPLEANVSAGFFLRENGGFQTSTPLEFPFHQRELGGANGPSPRRKSLFERDSRTLVPEVVAEGYDEPVTDLKDRPRAPLRGGWVWIPLSFIFLLLGVLLGFQAALTMASKSSEGSTQDYSLGLSVSKANENLAVKWDRQAAAIRAAQNGLLLIEDGTFAKSVELDKAQLQNGNLLYRNSSDMVRIRLVVYPKTRVSVTETMEWRK